MVFSSIAFLFFFLPLFLAAYFLTPTIRGKNLVTLLLSLIFYAWGEPANVALLLGSIAFNTVGAQAIDRRERTSRRAALTIVVCVNLGLLAVFKYAGFIVESLNGLVQPLGLAMPVPKIELPLGISFFTFHCLSYAIDVYRRRFPANRDPVEVALYIALFPQLVAGPIVRYKTVARQLRERRHTLGRAAAGARIAIIGLAQKVLIADQVAPLVEAVFDRTQHPTLAESWLGLLSYTVQIYFDFAGYSNIAIGLGLVLGFTLPRNFRLPYTAVTISDFWRRWHMSLSAWLRDYLYIPLGGSRGGRWQTWRNLVTVFLLCGLWHGASWNFVLWGAWHGTFLVAERIGAERRPLRVPVLFGWSYTMLAVMGGWVLFRAHDLSTALTMYAGLAGCNGVALTGLDVRMELHPSSVVPLLAGCALALWRPGIVPQIWRQSLRRIWPARLWPVADGAWTLALLLVSMIWVGAGAHTAFLYFRF
jgi:alginate O-acetyltransferase complex protein AlgI